ncbi:hypothetical protein FKW77_001777 [Venturia effusa]|uniref:Uncharacterized protein n=1 Tax=Venturia effusa TaxID=50376 RepID=A0A517LJP9_9PEZI|nr:hypothetical protein FKW77_001777 [Venturia effusa]
MECAGAAFSISPLLTTCSKISTVLLNVGKRFKKAPLMMTSIGTECNLIHVALSQVRAFDWSGMAGYTDGRLEQMTRATESIILGCHLTLSVIEEYALELQDYVEGTPLSQTEQMGIMARVQVLWKEEEMRELLLQLRGYQSALTALIRAAHDADFSDSQDDFAASNFAALLQRSRSSRVRKPLSIRAALQQAATYSNLSQNTNSNCSHITKSNHSATPSSSTIQSRQSSTPSSISHTASTQSLSALAVDLLDGAVPTPLVRKLTSDAARRKRPALLALQSEESNNAVVEGRDIHTNRKKDQLRRSSPTVGQNFTFVPGEPPLSGSPSPSKDENITTALEEKTADPRDDQIPPPLEPLSSPPPTAPLPIPPSRSPSRSRSPHCAPEMPARAPSRASMVGTRDGCMNRRPLSVPSSNHVTPPTKENEHQNDAGGEEPVGSQEETKSHEEHPDAEDGHSQPATPPAEPPSSSQPRGITTSDDRIAEPRKQKSCSSMRSLIIGLPETARLRKKASAEAFRKKPSTERSIIRPETKEPVPALPMTGVVGVVRGNAFGRQSLSSMLPPPRTSSIESPSEQNHKRSVTDLGNDTQIYSLPLRAPRGIGRSASDVRRPPHLRFPVPQRIETGKSLSPTASVSLSSPFNSLGSPLSGEPTSAISESWPLTPDDVHTPDYRHSLDEASRHTNRDLQPGGDYSRNSSSERHFTPSGSTSRLLSPDQTPRAGRSSVPHSLTPKTGRSRNNTLMTINLEAGAGETVDDSMSTAGSVAPSVMSAQWFRTPRERLGLGTQMSRAEGLPWEHLDVAHENLEAHVPAKPKTPPAKASRVANGVTNIFSVLPPRAPSRMIENEGRSNESPPRSPLLTQSFLTDVQTTLPQDRSAKIHVIDDPPRPSTSVKSKREGATSDWPRTKSVRSTKEQRDAKKKRKRENSRFPTLGDMVKEYKAMTAIRYTATYAQAAEEQRIEKEIRQGKRPATSSTGSIRLGATTSLELQAPSPTNAGINNERSDSLHTSHSNLRPGTDSSSSHAGTANEHSSHRVGPHGTHLQANGHYFDAAAARAKEEKKQRKDGKKPSAFPTVKGMWSDYKKNA